MSKKGAFSIRFSGKESTQGCMSLLHDFRNKEYLDRMLHSSNSRDRSIVRDIIQNRSENNIYWELESGKQLEDYQREAEERYKNAFHQNVQKGTMFIRPAILTVSENTNLEQILEMAKKVYEICGLTMTHAAFHQDEGHYETTKDGKRIFKGNYHIHAYFLSQHLEDRVTIDKKTGEKKVVKAGRTCRNLPFSLLQEKLAPIFGMVRGDIKNADPKAYLDPKLKFESERTHKAAQLIKAEAKMKELDGKLKNGLEKLEKQNDAITKNYERIRKQTQIIDSQAEGMFLSYKEIEQKTAAAESKLYELQQNIEEIERLKIASNNQSDIIGIVENIKPKGLLNNYSAEDVDVLKRMVLKESKEINLLKAKCNAEATRRIKAEEELAKINKIMNDTLALENLLKNRKKKAKYKFYENAIQNITGKMVVIKEMEENEELKFIRLTSNICLAINKVGNIYTTNDANITQLKDCIENKSKSIWKRIGNINEHTQATFFKQSNNEYKVQRNRIDL